MYFIQKLMYIYHAIMYKFTVAVFVFLLYINSCQQNLILKKLQRTFAKSVTAIRIEEGRYIIMKEKVVLAYSGGLDTTAIIPWLKETYD